MARVPTGNPRGRPKGGVKTGGRIAGKSLDRHARQLVSSELAGSILATFEQLGGTADMVKWAAANRTTFYTQILSRLMPAPQKDDPDIVQNNQFNLGEGWSEFEAARRISFAFAKAVYEDPSHVPIEVEMTPQQACSWRYPTPSASPTAEPVESPQQQCVEPDPAKALWVEEISLNQEQKRDRALLRQTQTATLENYAGGSSAEQGDHGQRQSSVTSKPTAAQLCRRMSRRGRDLL